MTRGSSCAAAFVRKVIVSPTFPRLLLDHAARRPSAPALREKDFGIWQTLTWSELAALVRAMACGLAEAGLQRGQHLVVIGENRPRLYAAMLATQALGAIPVPLYQDAAATEFVFPIGNAEVAFAIVEDQEQVDKMIEVRATCPQVAHIWYDDPRGLRNYSEPGLAPLDALVAAGRAWDEKHPGFFEAEVAKAKASDVAALFFTSGTTGNPKGVVHTHETLIDRAAAGARFDKLTADDEVLAYLPPAWIGQNIFSYAQWLVCGYIVNCPESAGTVTIDLKEIGPTYYFAPPSVFENLLTSVMIRMEDAGRPKRWLFDRAMALARRVGPALMDGKPVGALDRFRYALGKVLIYAPLRNTLGFSRVRVAYTAGEAIGADLFTFYRSLGINLKQLYGSTETAVFVCLQPDNQARADTVGIPIEGVEIKVAESGEGILIRSPGLLKEGTTRNPAATAEVLSADGWYRTGDAGFMDAAGHLKIIDRAKDVGRLAGGPSDGALFRPEVRGEQAQVLPLHQGGGEARPAQRASRLCRHRPRGGRQLGRSATSRTRYAELSQKPRFGPDPGVRPKVNADLATDEKLAGSQISRFLILHKELDADDGELTRTRKVRRSYIAERYDVLVDALYGGKSEQYVETQVKFEDGRTGKVAATLKIIDVPTFAAVGRAA